MASLAVAGLGAALGSATGIGASLGWTIGAAIGGVLFKESGPDIDQVGARLDDLRVTSSAYGQAVPLVYGMVSVPGNIIQSSPIRETVTTESQEQGKGGGGQKVTQTTYSYDVDLAVGLCEGELQSVVQIYANEQLIYDATIGSQVIQPEWLKFRLLKGTETQGVDPTLEALTGEDTPAYRGLAYLVFESLQLADFNNSIPNFRVVVVKSGGVEEHPVTKIPNPVLDGVEYYLFDYRSRTTWDDVNELLWCSIVPSTGIGDFVYGAVAIDPYTKRIVRALKMPPNYQSDGRGAGPKIWKCMYNGRVTLIHVVGWAAYRQENQIHWVDASTGEVITTIVAYGSIADELQKPSAPSSSPNFMSVYPHYTGAGQANKIRHFVPGALFGTSSPVSYFDYAPPSGSWPSTIQIRAFEPCEQTGKVCCVGRSTDVTKDGIWMWIFDASYPAFDIMTGMYTEKDKVVGEVWDLTDFIENQLQTDIYDASGGQIFIEEVFWDSAEQCFWIRLMQSSASMFIQVFDDGTLGRVYDYRPIVPYGDLCNVCGEPKMWFDAESGKAYNWAGSTAVAYDLRHGTAKLTDGYIADVQSPGGGCGMYFAPTNELFGCDGQGKWTGPYYYEHGGAAMRLDAYSDGSTSVKEIVDDVMRRANYESTEFATTELASDIVDGYRISSAQSARSAIAPLGQYSQFDIVDSEGQLKFRKRGKVSVATIPQDDLAVHYDGEATPRKLEKMRAHDTALPKRLNVKYIDKDLNYEVGSQRALRQASVSEQELPIDLPIVLDYIKGAQFADVYLHLQHIERMTYAFNIPYEYAYLEPGDVVDVVDEGNVYRVRIRQMDMDRGVIKVKAVADLKSAYSSSAIGQPGIGTSRAVIKTVGKTHIYAMNLPAMRDAELSTPYWFIGAGGTSEGWSGGGAYVSSDGSTYTLGAHLDVALVAGSMLSVPSWTMPYPDTMGEYTVFLNSGTLSSVTHDQWKSGQYNVAALQGLYSDKAEIITFQYATLISDNRWVLKNVMRGRFGTEKVTVSGSSVLFRLLDQTRMARISVETADIGVSRSVRGVSDGAYVYGDNVITQTFIPRAANLIPYAPAQPKAVFETNGDITISWEARDRARPSMLHEPVNSDPLDFEIEILSASGSVLNTYTVTGAKTFTLLQANKEADYGSDVSYIYAKIYRKSALTEIGRGYGAFLKASKGLPGFVDNTSSVDTSSDSTNIKNAYDGNLGTEFYASTGSPLSVAVDGQPGSHLYVFRFYAHSNADYRPTSIDVQFQYRRAYVLNYFNATLTLSNDAGWQTVYVPREDVIHIDDADVAGDTLIERVVFNNPTGHIGSYWGVAEVQLGYFDF